MGALLFTLLAQQQSFWPWDRQPYLLSLSLKRLEIVGDILQLLLQLGTLTVGFCKKRGEKRKRRSGRERQETRSESTCREDQEVLLGDCLRSDWIGPCFEAPVQKASSLFASELMFEIFCQHMHGAQS